LIAVIEHLEGPSTTSGKGDKYKMGIKIKQTIVLKMTQEEYDFLMYLRREGVELRKFSPGSLVIHFDNGNRIKKHEMHIYKTSTGDSAAEVRG